MGRFRIGRAAAAAFCIAASGCTRSAPGTPPAPPDAGQPTVGLTHAQVEERVTTLITRMHLDHSVQFHGDALRIDIPQGNATEISLKSVYSVCAKSAEECDKLLPSLMRVFSEATEHHGDSDAATPRPPQAPSRAVPASGAAPH